MKRMLPVAPRSALVWALVCTLACTGLALAQDADPMLSDTEREELIELLESSQQELEQLTAQTTDEAWSKSPAEGRWSVGETVEHLVLVEEGIFGMMLQSTAGAADPDWAATAATSVADLKAMMSDRSQKFPAPEGFEPKGEFSREELLEKFDELRARTLEFARTTELPLKQFTATGSAGKMNAHQWLALIGAHNLRHDQQIIEVQEQLAAVQ